LYLDSLTLKENDKIGFNDVVIVLVCLFSLLHVLYFIIDINIDLSNNITEESNLYTYMVLSPKRLYLPPDGDYVVKVHNSEIDKNRITGSEKEFYLYLQLDFQNNKTLLLMIRDAYLSDLIVRFEFVTLVKKSI
jgi:hypothetical protein